MTKSHITFGTDGWRALIADTFTFDNVRLVATAIGRYIDETYPADRPVLIGYDTRFLAREFAEAAGRVVGRGGRKVLITERDVPTPVIAFAAQHEHSAGALMFTASHNPAPYCGIKYIPDYAGPATPAITDAIVRYVRELEGGEAVAADGNVVLHSYDPVPAYRQALEQLVDGERLAARKLKVVYDPLYSTGRGYLDAFLRDHGCQVTTLHDWRDPLFGGGMPDPAPAQLGELRERVAQERADLGMATDGDSDRFGIIDSDGRFFTPNQVISLLLRHLVKNRGAKGAVVRTVATTHLIDRIAAKYGVEVIETPVGFKYVGEIMRNRPVIIGGEESGGLSIIGHIPEKDGILANLLIAEMVAWEGRPLAQIWQDLEAEAQFTPANLRLDLHLTDAEKGRVMAGFQGDLKGLLDGWAIEKRETMDGQKLYLSGGSWLLARASGTEPLIRVYLEAPDQATLGRLKGAAEACVTSLRGR